MFGGTLVPVVSRAVAWRVQDYLEAARPSVDAPAVVPVLVLARLDGLDAPAMVGGEA